MRAMRGRFWFGGVTKEGFKVDLTPLAKFKPDEKQLCGVEGSFLQPQKVGEGSVTVSASGKQAKLAINVLSVEQPAVRFGRDVMPLMASVGCNAGLCHGSAKGKNGFKLS